MLPNGRSITSVKDHPAKEESNELILKGIKTRKAIQFVDKLVSANSPKSLLRTVAI